MEILSIWTYRSYIIGRFKPTDWVVIKDWIGQFKPIDYIRSVSEIDKMSIFNRSKKTYRLQTCRYSRVGRNPTYRLRLYMVQKRTKNLILATLEIHFYGKQYIHRKQEIAASSSSTTNTACWSFILNEINRFFYRLCTIDRL